ncbi:hypothetical protein RBH29_03695 [Herbivorax sp. ANBcel31]|nr:hypothetical protein [Herbivorax sp. ANBcel31]MDQ2085536.1 hypothetical protein [Herbivorax sp. ANBcel31]
MAGKNNLVYTITKENHHPKALKKILIKHPEIQFVSLMGVDL